MHAVDPLSWVPAGVTELTQSNSAVGCNLLPGRFSATMHVAPCASRRGAFQQSRRGCVGS